MRARQTERQTQRESAWGRDGGREPADVFCFLLLFGFLVFCLIFLWCFTRLIRDGEPRTATPTFTRLLSFVSR